MGQTIGRDIEQAVEEMVGLCPWMTDVDAGRFVRMFSASLPLEGYWNIQVVVEEAFALWRRSVQVGDRRREWAFYHCYQWACASERGEEYSCPEMPAEIAQLP